MDFHKLLEVATKKQEKTQKQVNPAKAAREKYKNNVNSDNIKKFLQRQKEEEKKKEEEAKRKKIELLRLRVEENAKGKPVEKPKVNKELDIFDMNDEEAEKARQIQLKTQSSEEFTGLKISDFDFETKKDRKARVPNNATMAAKEKLERIKAKMKTGVTGSSVDRMAEIDKELSDDEKRRKSKSSDKDRHSSSSKDKHRDKHKHRDDKHRSKHSSSSSSHKHSSSKSSSSSKRPYSSSNHNVSSDSEMSDISLEDVKPKKSQTWVSVKKTPVEQPKPQPKINKPKTAAPPTLSYAEIMALAAQKKSEPVALKPSEMKIPKKKTVERPMTQEEKDREARKNTPEYREWLKTGKKAAPKPRPALAPHPTKPGVTVSESRPKPVVPHPTRPGGITNGVDKNPRNGISSSLSKSSAVRESPKLERSTFTNNNGQNRESSKNGHRESSKNGQSRESSKSAPKVSSASQKAEEMRLVLEKQKEMMRKQQEMYDNLMKKIQGEEKKKATPKPSSSSSKPSGSSGSSSSKQKPTSSSSSSSKNGVVPASKRPKHDMSDDEDEPPKKKPMKTPASAYANPFDRIMGSIQQRNPKPKPKPKPQRIEDDFDELEDDVDGEFNDFIDDEEEPAADVSKVIRSIFGYDRRKFRNERDEDLRGMEANFAQISKEEARSARLGMKEDLEDIQREEEELKRKKKKMNM